MQYIKYRIEKAKNEMLLQELNTLKAAAAVVHDASKNNTDFFQLNGVLDAMNSEIQIGNRAEHSTTPKEFAWGETLSISSECLCSDGDSNKESKGGTRPQNNPKWTVGEDEILLECVKKHGNKWAAIASEVNDRCLAISGVVRTVEGCAKRNRRLIKLGGVTPQTASL